MNQVQQGWQCPVCKRILAPWVQSCDCQIVQPSEAPQPIIFPNIPYQPYTPWSPPYSPWCAPYVTWTVIEGQNTVTI